MFVNLSAMKEILSTTRKKVDSVPSFAIGIGMMAGAGSFLPHLEKIQ
jgi:hypothetical protein